MLRINHLYTGYGRTAVGKNLCAHLPDRSLTALFGINGSGKSTLLRTLAGLIPPLVVREQPRPLQQIAWNNKNLLRTTPREMARIVSIVLTSRVEADALTAEEVVEMGRIPYTTLMPKRGDADLRAIEKAIEMTGLEPLRRRPIKTLSDGERQRVFIAKALAQDTPIILLDEPTAYLDLPTKVYMLRLLAKLAHEANKTLLISTHDVELALPFAAHLWLLGKGEIVEGTPASLAHEGVLTKYFQSENLSFNAQTLRFEYATTSLTDKKDLL